MTKSSQTHTQNSRQGQRLERERRQAVHERSRWLWIGAGLIGVLVVGVILLSTHSTSQADDSEQPKADRALGPATARVTIVEYGDFGCPTCRAWHNADILNQIRARYGDKVRFVWRDFPVITAQSPKAAEAAQCAHDQGKFWEYHDTLFARAPVLDVDSLKSYASIVGLDAARFGQCLDSGQHSASVDRDLKDALARGFRGTPSFLVNDRPLAGPPSFDTLQRLIDPILAAGG